MPHGEARLLVRITAEAPMRNRVLGISMLRLSPAYQFCVMFSVLTTSALALASTCAQQPTESFEKTKPTLTMHA